MPPSIGTVYRADWDGELGRRRRELMARLTPILGFAIKVVCRTCREKFKEPLPTIKFVGGSPMWGGHVYQMYTGS